MCCDGCPVIGPAGGSAPPGESVLPRAQGPSRVTKCVSDCGLSQTALVAQPPSSTHNVHASTQRSTRSGRPLQRGGTHPRPHTGGTPTATSTDIGKASCRCAHVRTRGWGPVQQVPAAATHTHTQAEAHRPEGSNTTGTESAIGNRDGGTQRCRHTQPQPRRQHPRMPGNIRGGGGTACRHTAALGLHRARQHTRRRQPRLGSTHETDQALTTSMAQGM